jgi:hypothetical protein
MDDLTRKAKTDPTELYAHRNSAYAPEFVAVAVAALDFFSLLC